MQILKISLFHLPLSSSFFNRRYPTSFVVAVVLLFFSLSSLLTVAEITGADMGRVIAFVVKFGVVALETFPVLICRRCTIDGAVVTAEDVVGGDATFDSFGLLAFCDDADETF